MVFIEIKKTPKWEKMLRAIMAALTGNLNETERSAIDRYRNFNAPKICKITVH